MPKQIALLHLEDDPIDAELIRSSIEAAGLDCEFTCVATRQEFEAAINEKSFDVILSDYGVPGYNGFAALKFAREKNPLVPFILLSGSSGDEQAMDSVKTGVTDYILKQELVRLGPAIIRALADAKQRAEGKGGEEQLNP